MATTNAENGMTRYNEPKAYVTVDDHFPDKRIVEFLCLINLVKYTQKKIKAVTFPEE